MICLSRSSAFNVLCTNLASGDGHLPQGDAAVVGGDALVDVDPEAGFSQAAIGSFQEDAVLEAAPTQGSTLRP